MVWVDEARKYDFKMMLHEDVMRSILNGAGVESVLTNTAAKVESGIEQHVRATANNRDAENYVASLFVQDAFSDEYNFDYGGPYGLGNRQIRIIGISSGRGNNPDARPPFMTESRTHALTSVPGFQVGANEGEDIT